MKFSFIIPALNEAKYISACIKSIKNQSVIAHEIIVVDNGSVDETAETAKSLGARVIKETKSGIANARNAGATQSSGEILCFIDADSTLCRNWIKRAQNHFEKGASAVVGINVFVNKNPIKLVWYNSYTIIAHAALFLNNFLFRRLLLSAGNLAIKKDVFEKLGGYEPYVGEDFWLSQRFWKLGLRGTFDPFMIVHSSSRGFEKRGFLATIWYWIKSTPRKVAQNQYSYKSKI